MTTNAKHGIHVTASRRSNFAKSGAFTLIEVLVVISIIALITAFLIPQLRTLNKERVSREAGRVVASMFTQASQRAAIDGVAGVLLQRNPNYADGNGYSHGVTGMSLLRAVPAFVGDQETDRATQGNNDNQVIIPLPLEQTALEIVRAGDAISFNNSSLEYTISSVTVDGNDLRLDLDLTGSRSYLPSITTVMTNTALLIPAGVPFRIRRLPRPLKSSFTELPQGFIIDLRFSGFTMLDSGFDVFPNTATRMAFPTQVFERHPRIPDLSDPTGMSLVDFADSNVAILFGPDGELDRMVMLDQDLAGNTVAFPPRQLIDNLRLFVAEPELNDPSGTIVELNPLNSPTNLWVSVNKGTGNTNVGYNVVPATQLDLVSLENRFNGNADDRARFNAVINEARGDADVATAAQ